MAQDKSSFWYLKNFNLFEELPEEELQDLASMTKMHRTSKRDIIYFPASPSHNIYFLKEGHVKFSRINEEGKEIILDILGPGELFGELVEMDPGTPRNEIAEALDNVLICTLNRNDFTALVERNPSLNFQIVRRVGLRLRKFEERVESLVFKDSATRVRELLVHLAEEFGKIKEGHITIPGILSHQDIAELSGTSRQTATTILNDLRSQGLIDFDRKSIRIPDLEKLR